MTEHEVRARRSRYGGNAANYWGDEDDDPGRWKRGLVAIALVLALVAGVVLIRGGAFLSRISSQGLGGLFGYSAVGSKLDHGDRVNILLLGYGGVQHQGAYLTDSLMILSLNPKTGQTAYISIPRDLEVRVYAFQDTTRYATVKINAAYSIAMQPENWGGGLQSKYSTSDRRDGASLLAADTISRVTGIPIDYTADVDFGGFRQVVDAVGGIDIDVPETFSIDFPNYRGWTTVHFQKGWEHMNGKRALAYVRGRYVACTETQRWSYDRRGHLLCAGYPVTDANQREASDFARAQRQQEFLEDFRAQAVKLDLIAKLPSVLSGLEAHVRTNLAVPADIEALWGQQKKLRRSGVLHISLNSSNLLYSCTCDDNGYTLHPYGDGGMLERYLDNVFQAPAVKEHAPITVVDASGDDGRLGGIWRDMLTQLGFKVRDGGTYGYQAGSAVRDGTGGKAGHTAAYLSWFFKAKAGAGGRGGVTLVLGHDAYSALFIGSPQGSAAVVKTGQHGGTLPSPVPSSSTAPAGGGDEGGGGGGGGGGLPLPSLPPPPLPSPP